MGTPPREALARLRAAADSGELDRLCERYGVAILTVFGSAVQEESTPRDLDVAVAFRPDVGRPVLELLDGLARLTGSDDLDLMVLNNAGPVARERALVGSLGLYEYRRSALANAQMAAMAERMDTAWLRKLDLDLLAE